jgi:hypothetical protein
MCGPFCRITKVHVASGVNLLESINWTWGLSLIALTIAIHAMGVVMLALVGFGIRARLETRKLGLRHLIPIVIGIVGAVGLLLAVLHGIEAAIWAAAYVWLGALDSTKSFLVGARADFHVIKGSTALLGVKTTVVARISKV